MRRRFSVLVNLVVILGLLLSGVLVVSPFAAESGQALGTTPGSDRTEMTETAFARKPAKTKKDRRQERRQDARKDRKRDRVRATPRKGRASAAPPAARLEDFVRMEATLPEPRSAEPGVPDSSEPGPIEVGDLDSAECASLQSMERQQIDICSHGPDDPPPGFAIDNPVPLLSAAEAEAEVSAEEIACLGDGQTGNRIRVFYVRASDKPNNYAASIPTIRAILAEMDLIFRQNSFGTGGPTRSVRFWQDDQTCLPWVSEAVVSPAGDDSWGAMVDELKNRATDPLNRTDRMYLLFADATLICGEGGAWPDDRASTSLNKSNFGPNWSRVDRGCWTAATAAHEVLHNLGAVQDSAPNSSLGGHCIDEWDIMCYSDSPRRPAMRYDCPTGSWNATKIDCNHNDYFHMNPPAGSYLATHWNTARNQFLGLAFDPPPPPPVVAPPPVTSSGGKHKKKPKKAGKKGNGRGKGKGKR